MLIFKLLDQYRSICQSNLCGCTTKLSKSIRNNITEILLLTMVIPGKINFQQHGRYDDRCEQCYRQTYEQEFDWLQFNMNLAANRFRTAANGLP